MVLDRAIRYGNDNGTSVYDSCGLQLVDYKKFLHYSAFTRFSCRFMLSKLRWRCENMIDSHELRRRDGTPRHDQRTADAIRIISQLRFLFECKQL